MKVVDASGEAAMLYWSRRRITFAPFSSSIHLAGEIVYE